MKLAQLARKVRRLSRREQFELVRATVELSAVEVLLRTMPLPRVCALLGITLQPSRDAAHGFVTPDPIPTPSRLELQALRSVLARWPLGGPCLRFSLVLGWRQRWRAPGLILGVQRSRSQLYGHAWLQVGDLYYDYEAGATAVRVPASGFTPLSAIP